MPEINANIVVEPIQLSIVPNEPTITVAPEPLNLNIYTGGIAAPSGNLGDIQYNAGGVFGGIPTANYVAGNLSLGDVANLKVDGGNNAYYLQTDGSGNLTWAPGTGNVIGNGTAAGANTQIQFTDGAGNFLAAAGFTFDNASNIFSAPGLINGAGNLQVLNANLGNVATANYFNGIFAAGNSNIAITSNNEIRISPSGAANLYTFALAEANLNSNVNISDNLLVVGNANIVGNVQVGSIANGNSNITLIANGNIELTAMGNTTLTVTNTSIDVSGNVDFSTSLNGPNGNFSGNVNSNNLFVSNIANISGNLNALANLNISSNLNVTGKSNLNAVGNVIITGGANGQFIKTDGNGNLSFGTVSTSGISNGTSSVTIPVANGNIVNTVDGNVILTVTSLGANLQGTFTANGVVCSNANITNQLNVGNITVTNGFSIALGNGASAGNVSTGSAVALGWSANANNTSGTAIGYSAKAQRARTTAIGFATGSGGTPGIECVFIGYNSGLVGNGNVYSGSTFVGTYAGQRQDGEYNVAIGHAAGMGVYGNSTIANGQGRGSIAIGASAGRTNQKQDAIAIGYQAGTDNQGNSSIAIGANSAINNAQANNSIILNATGLNVDNTTANSFVVKPIRNTSSGNVLYYNQSTGEIVYDSPAYGSFFSNVTQTSNGANTTNYMTFNNTDMNDDVSIASNSQITIARTGKYDIQFSAQLQHDTNQTANVEIWLVKNGSGVADTNTILTLTKDERQVAAWNFLVNAANVNDYWQLAWASSDTNVELFAVTAANTIANIAVPSVICTVTPVGT